MDTPTPTPNPEPRTPTPELNHDPIWIIDHCKVNPFPGSFLEYRDLLAEEMKKART